MNFSMSSSLSCASFSMPPNATAPALSDLHQNDTDFVTLLTVQAYLISTSS